MPNHKRLLELPLSGLEAERQRIYEEITDIQMQIRASPTGPSGSRHKGAYELPICRLFFLLFRMDPSDYSEIDVEPTLGRWKSKSSPKDFRHLSRGRFFINCFALPAAFGIPSPASRIFGRESRNPPAQSICTLRNKFRSCVRDLLARCGFYLLRAQKYRWKYRTSAGFSPLPAAGQEFC